MVDPTDNHLPSDYQLDDEELDNVSGGGYGGNGGAGGVGGNGGPAA